MRMYYVHRSDSVQFPPCIFTFGIVIRQLLLPRMGFLPCVAEAVSHHFGEAAPEAQRSLWLEEACSGEPLRW